MKNVQNCCKSLDGMQVRNEGPCTRLFAEYEQLLVATARRYQSGGYYQDAYQEACVAFMNAIREWQPDFGVPFPAFAKAKVRGDVRTAMRRIWRYEDRRILTRNQGEADEDSVNELWDMAAVGETAGYSFGLADIELSLDISDLIKQADLSVRERLYVKWLLEGRTLKEMAALAHVSVETVKTWRKRGMLKLRSKIEFLLVDDE